MSSAVCEPSRKLTWVKKMNAKVKSSQPSDDQSSAGKDRKRTKAPETK